MCFVCLNSITTVYIGFTLLFPNVLFLNLFVEISVRLSAWLCVAPRLQQVPQAVIFQSGTWSSARGGTFNPSNIAFKSPEIRENSESINWGLISWNPPVCEFVDTWLCCPAGQYGGSPLPPHSNQLLPPSCFKSADTKLDLYCPSIHTHTLERTNAGNFRKPGEPTVDCITSI